MEDRIQQLEIASQEHVQSSEPVNEETQTSVVEDLPSVSAVENLAPIFIPQSNEPPTSVSGFQSPPVTATSYFRWDEPGSGDDPFAIAQTTSQQDFSFAPQPAVRFVYLRFQVLKINRLS
jgi:hypothetical protein